MLAVSMKSTMTIFCAVVLSCAEARIGKRMITQGVITPEPTDAEAFRQDGLEKWDLVRLAAIKQREMDGEDLKQCVQLYACDKRKWKTENHKDYSHEFPPEVTIKIFEALGRLFDFQQSGGILSPDTEEFRCVEVSVRGRPYTVNLVEGTQFQSGNHICRRCVRLKVYESSTANGPPPLPPPSGQQYVGEHGGQQYATLDEIHIECASAKEKLTDIECELATLKEENDDLKRRVGLLERPPCCLFPSWSFCSKP